MPEETMKGKVSRIEKPLVYVILEDGQRCWFELDGHDVAVGDIVSGNMRIHGDSKLTNETKGNVIDAYIQGFT